MRCGTSSNARTDRRRGLPERGSDAPRRASEVLDRVESQSRCREDVLDGRLASAPNINEPITGGTASISGRFTQREAFELANVLNNPLDLPLSIAEQYEVGPSLATDAVASTTGRVRADTPPI